MTEKSNRVDNTAPIGVFDSGLGGLTVLRKLIDLLPQENFLYLADTANAPYGCNSSERILHDTLESVEFLLSQGVKLIVIACNTASAVGLDLAREKAGSVPLLGVIEAGIESSVKQADRGDSVKIAVIATEATVANGVFVRELPLKFIESGLAEPQVIQKACQQFIQVIEDGQWDDPLADKIAEQCLSEIRAEDPDLTVLACTHFPLMTNAIQKALPDTQLVDSSKTLANEVKKLLKSMDLLNIEKTEAELNFYVTEEKTGIEQNIERILDIEIERVHHVDIKKCGGD